MVRMKIYKLFQLRDNTNEESLSEDTREGL